MKSDESVIPLAAQFVPIKIDVETDAYKDWARLFPHEGGNAIPVVYVIRADGQKQYAKTGSLGAAALKNLLSANLATAGTLLNEAQIGQLVSIQEKLTRAVTRKKWSEAIQLVNRVTTIETPDIKASFAQPAVIFQQLVEKLSQGVQADAAKITDDLVENSTNPAQKIDAAFQFGKLELEIKESPNADEWLSPSFSILAMDKEVIEYLGMVRTVFEFQETKDERERASVEKIASTQRDNRIGKLASKLVGSPATAGNTSRTWTSANGRFQLEARYLSQTADRVKLIKADGNMIEVDIAKLSKADIRYLRRQR